MCTDLILTGTIQSGIVRGLLSVGIEDRDCQYCMFNPLDKLGEGGSEEEGGRKRGQHNLNIFFLLRVLPYEGNNLCYTIQVQHTMK